MTTHADAAPAVLENLIAAGLVDHEVIGDPERIASETAVLKLLTSLVAGPVYRLEPYHYAFPLRAGDLSGALDAAAPATWGQALAAALDAGLGPEAAWVNATDLVAETGQEPAPQAGPVADQVATGITEQPVVLLRAWSEAAQAGVAAIGPEVRAVIDARYAAATAQATAALTARLAAEAAGEAAGEAGGLEARLERIEATLARLGTDVGEAAARTEGIATLGRAVEALAQRDATAAFEERIGLVLAEFLARIETAVETRRHRGRPQARPWARERPRRAPGRGRLRWNRA